MGIFNHIITVDSERCGGKPCIRNSRISVMDVMDYLAGGMSPEEIVSDFPELSVEDIHACIKLTGDSNHVHLTVPQ